MARFAAVSLGLIVLGSVFLAPAWSQLDGVGPEMLVGVWLRDEDASDNVEAQLEDDGHAEFAQLAGVGSAVVEEVALHELLGERATALLALAAAQVDQQGAGDASLGALRAATDRYGALLKEFSGGRGDLEATLSGFLPEERIRAEIAGGVPSS